MYRIFFSRFKNSIHELGTKVSSPAETGKANITTETITKKLNSIQSLFTYQIIIKKNLLLVYYLSEKGKKKKHFQYKHNNCSHIQTHHRQLTLDVPVTNCNNRALSSLLKPYTTSQNHWITGDPALYPEYSVFALMSSTEMM